VHAAGERVYLSKEGEGPQEIDLGTAEAAARVEPLPESVTPTVRPSETWEPGSEEPAPPGVSVLDELSDGGKAPDGGESR
jgi:hypothetical protein